jgi:hypothetical protein
VCIERLSRDSAFDAFDWGVPTRLGDDMTATSEFVPMTSKADGDRPAAVKPKRGPGRPPVHDEEWTKVTVVLFNRQIDFLDDLVDRIRTQNSTSVSRAQLIRALVDAAADAGIDLTTARSEAELKATVLRRLRAYS